MSRPECMHDAEDAGLQSLAAAVSRAFEPMPGDARARVQAHLDSATRAERVPLRARLVRPLIAIAVGASMVGGVSMAAAASAPGDVLYPLKRSVASLAGSLEPPAAQPELKPKPVSVAPALVDADPRTDFAPPAAMRRRGADAEGSKKSAEARSRGDRRIAKGAKKAGTGKNAASGSGKGGTSSRFRTPHVESRGPAGGRR